MPKIWFIRFYSLPLLSGVLMGLSFMPFPPWALFFCYVPLWLFALKRRSFKELFIGGWLSQFVGTLISLNWLAGAIHEFGIWPWPWPLFGLLTFASLANLHIPLALWLWLASKKAISYIKASSKLSQPFSSGLFLLPLFSALGMEHGSLFFKWHFGYPWLYAGWPAFQTAEIWGFQFLNSLTLFFNFLFLLTFKSLAHLRGLFVYNKCKSFLKFFAGQKAEEGKRPAVSFFKKAINQKMSLGSFLAIKNKSAFVPLLMGLVLFCALNIYGLYLKSRWIKPDQKASVLLIQPHIENQKQSKKEWDDFILSRLLQETSRHLWPEQQSFFEEDSSKGLTVPHPPEKRPSVLFPKENSFVSQKNLQKELAGEAKKLDFILWPEGGYPYPINKDLVLKGQDPVQKWPKVFNFPLIVSAERQGKGWQSNSIFVFDHKGRIVQGPYDKMLLMPLGEKAPLAKSLPQFSQSLFGNMAFNKGNGDNKVIYLNGLNLGFQICYESLFESLTRDLSKEGADILINVANDAWFGKWQEPWQNLYMTLARAIEVRRPLIRGTNSGLSAVISAKGDLIHLGNLAQKESWLIEVPYSLKNKRLTVFVSWGHLINPLFLGFSLIAWLFSLFFFRPKLV